MTQLELDARRIASEALAYAGDNIGEDHVRLAQAFTLKCREFDALAAAVRGLVIACECQVAMDRSYDGKITSRQRNEILMQHGYQIRQRPTHFVRQLRHYALAKISSLEAGE